MENFPITTMAPLLLRNLIMPIFIFAEKSLLDFTEKYKFLQLLRYLLVSSFLFFHQFLLSLLFPFSSSSSSPPSPETYYGYPPSKPDTCSSDADSGIARALSQLLSIMNNIPVSSRKYETVRLLAETLIEENLQQCSSVLRDVNCSALSAAFTTTLTQLETAAADRGGDAAATDDFVWERVFRAVRNYGNRFGKKEYLIRPGGSAEKLAAELLWLAEKMTACGCVEEAVRKWAFATNLAWMSLSYESRLQGALLKVSVFLIKEAKKMGFSDEYSRLLKMKILMAWLPLLCQASNGIDSPVLSLIERTELEIGLEEMIGELEENQQEDVLSLWLHHFTYNPTSDWPNLNKSYSSWCKASRKLLLLGNTNSFDIKINKRNCKQQKII